MIVLSAKNLTKSYGVNSVLKDVGFHLNTGDRVGIVGVNGAGKTTLLNILTGRGSPDEGELFVAPDIAVGYLRQNGNFDPERTVYEAMLGVFGDLLDMEREAEALSARIARVSETGGETDALLGRYADITEEFGRRGGYSCRSEAIGILTSMAFPESSFTRKISLLSGGERTRLSLAALLLEKPDLLLLDEPTNHLDIGTLAWLEQYLKNYGGTIVLVSHDRYFLDRTVNRIFEIENGSLTAYDGNYSEFAEKKRAKRETDIALWENSRREIEKQEELVRRLKQHGTEKLAKRARSREKRLALIEPPKRPENEPGRVRMRFRKNVKSGNDVLFAEGLSKSFEQDGARRLLFSGVDLDMKSGEHVCVVGANGIGKSTLLKILNGSLASDGGVLRTGHNVVIGYYDQERELLDDERSVLDEMTSAYRLYSDTEMRGMLGRFLFTGDAVFRKIGLLSGGERTRLCLLKLMLSGANCLLLDEPTNHLDIVSKEVFEEALREFPGTALIVSHDRYFLNRIPSRIAELTANGLVNYLGGYDYYSEKKESEASGRRRLADVANTAETDAADSTRDSGIASDAAEQRRRNKEIAAAEKRKAKALSDAEERISSLEDEIAGLEARLCDEAVFSDRARADEYSRRMEEAKDALAAAYAAWMELS
jgi:ATP-binding cassette subfamily F protein 3